MLTEKIYRASWLLPVSGPAIENGALYVRNGLISDVGDARSIFTKYPSAEVETYPNSVLLPSWVNAHCHLELSAYHNQITEFTDFVDWVRQLIALRSQTDRSVVLEYANQAAKTLNKSGCALVGDVTNGDLLREDSLDDGPERVVFYEILGFDPDRAFEIFDSARIKIQDENPSAKLVPHAPYSTSAQLMKLIAGSQGITCIHLAESAQESELIQFGSGLFRDFLEERGVWPEEWLPPQMSPIQYLDHQRIFDHQSLLVHCVQANQDDLKSIKNKSAMVCLCARSNDLLHVGQMPLDEYIQENIPVAIGTDSLASNIDLDMNNEIYYISKQFNNLNARDLIQMATLNGAIALGKDKEYGSLDRGKKARFNIFSSEGPIRIDAADFVVSKSWSKLHCF